MREPPEYVNEDGALEKIQGSMIGMALGDALGAHVEFRPREYLLANPVTDLQGGGTWSLRKGQVKLLFLIKQPLSSMSERVDKREKHRRRFFLSRSYLFTNVCTSLLPVVRLSIETTCFSL